MPRKSHFPVSISYLSTFLHYLRGFTTTSYSFINFLMYITVYSIPRNPFYLFYLGFRILVFSIPGFHGITALKWPY